MKFQIIFFAVLLFLLMLMTGALMEHYSITRCNDSLLIPCFFTNSLRAVPAWLGTFSGIFLSALLAYHFSRKKQIHDDNQKELNENFKSINKTMITIGQCISQLSTIKDVYIQKLINEKNAERSLLSLVVSYGTMPPQSLDAAGLYFLTDIETQGVHDLTLNPLYINSIVEMHNDILAHLKKRNELATYIRDQFIKNNTPITAHGICSISLDEIQKNNSYHDIVSYVKLSEKIFVEIDKCIDMLTSLCVQLPSLANIYFTNKKYSKKVKYITFDTSINKNLFLILPLVDIEEWMAGHSSGSFKSFNLDSLKY